MATWLHNVCIAVCVSAAVMAAGSCCCCGKYIVDSRERRKLSSQEGAAVVPANLRDFISLVQHQRCKGGNADNDGAALSPQAVEHNGQKGKAQ